MPMSMQKVVFSAQFITCRLKKELMVLCFAFTLALLAGCDSSLIVSRYTLKLPPLPPAWEIIPGELCWKIEWLAPDGRPQTLEIRSGETPEISLPHTFANAVTAWPYWPDLAISPGVFKSCGALFPFDVDGASLSLSWKGGLDAMLYRELGIASAGEPVSKSSVSRLPWNFNWPRFRELYDDPSVNAEYRADPWLADWPGIAEKIWQSGFDKRRLVPYARQELPVPVAQGPWIGTSPFAAPLVFEGSPVFPVRAAGTASVSNAGSSPVDTWVSADGILRCNADAYIFLEW